MKATTFLKTESLCQKLEIIAKTNGAEKYTIF